MSVEGVDPGWFAVHDRAPRPSGSRRRARACSPSSSGCSRRAPRGRAGARAPPPDRQLRDRPAAQRRPRRAHRARLALRPGPRRAPALPRAHRRRHAGRRAARRAPHRPPGRLHRGGDQALAARSLRADRVPARGRRCADRCRRCASRSSGRSGSPRPRTTRCPRPSPRGRARAARPTTSAGTSGSTTISSGSHWWWKRGAETAACASMRKSSALTIVSSVVLMMRGPPGLPVTITSRPSDQHDRRRHARERTLARRDRVGAAHVDEPVDVRLARRDREVVHLVVQQHAACRAP